jgi:RNA polymerase sigma-70 factor (TIGR02960 family)
MRATACWRGIIEPMDFPDEMDAVAASPEEELLASAREGDQGAFERLMSRHRGELYAHCYRMLGSVQDAEDALQESLLGAWRGLPGFEGRSSLRSWLYRISTNACLRLIGRRPPRMLSADRYPPLRDPGNLGEPVSGPVWLEPWPDELAGASAEPGESDPATRYLRRESVELAFVAALQHLPGTQRAVLILRDVLEFPAAEVARLLDTTPASVNSALQRARKAVEQRVPRTSQQAELDALDALGAAGAGGRRELVDALVSAWERADVPALLDLLAEDARFLMPPLPAWFEGRGDIGRFVTERMFAISWRLVPIRANGQLALACYQSEAGGDRFRLGVISVFSVRAGRIVQIVGFLDPALHRYFGLAEELA